jgi:deoxyhypusine synthase
MVFELQVHCDATIAFPLLVSQTFAPRVKLEGYERSGAGSS